MSNNFTKECNFKIVDLSLTRTYSCTDISNCNITNKSIAKILYNYLLGPNPSVVIFLVVSKYISFSEIKNRIKPTKPKLPISTSRTYSARLQKNSLFLEIMQIFTEYFALYSHFFSSKTVFNVIPLKRMN